MSENKFQTVGPNCSGKVVTVNAIHKCTELPFVDLMEIRDM